VAHEKHCALCDLSVGEAGEVPIAGELVDGRYRVLGSIGAGGFGTVLRAEDVHLRRQVAIKLAHSDVDLHALAIDFQAEAAALAAMRHDNVVGVYAFGMHAGAPFFVMESVTGESLEQVMSMHAAHGAQVPMHTALNVVQKIALGLGAAHAAGLVHRDVKPENVIIERHTGRPVLIDFGISVPTRRTVDNVVGTASYMAPEAAKTGEHIGPAADQYSLACMAFEMLTGELPFATMNPIATMSQHMSAPRPLASMRLPALAPCDEVLVRGMAIDPTQRWSSCLAFAEALADVARALPSPPPSPLDSGMHVLPSSRRVLVVDDDPVAVKLVSRAAQIAFAGGDVAVSRARTGPDAIANAERAMPALLVLDYHLPGLDGVEVLSRIRTLPGGDRVAVLVASGTVGASERWRFSILGVHDFIDKPFEFVHMVDRIASVARRRGWVVGESSDTAADPPRESES
jgi:serine/threonine-protein kinase